MTDVTLADAKENSMLAIDDVAVFADDDVYIDDNVDPLMLKMIFTKKQSHSLIHGSVTIPCN